MTEIDKLKNNSSICVFLNGDLMKFEFDDAMQMTLAIEPNQNNFELMLAMLVDAVRPVVNEVEAMTA
jgi:hypothetical protein